MTPDDPDCFIEWKPTLRTVLTRDEITQIVAAIQAHEPARTASSALTSQPATR
jgi:hypothetical protein